MQAPQGPKTSPFTSLKTRHLSSVLKPTLCGTLFEKFKYPGGARMSMSVPSDLAMQVQATDGSVDFRALARVLLATSADLLASTGLAP